MGKIKMNKNEKESRRLIELGHGLYVIGKLKKLSKTINTIDCHFCNGDYKTDAEGMSADKRIRKLIYKATGLAELLDFKVYHQSDPRGCPLYLVTNDMLKTGQYTGGIAL